MTPLALTLTIAAGAVGALVRHLIHAWPSTARPGDVSGTRRRALSPPWRITAINVTASFLAGFAYIALPLLVADAAELWEAVFIGGFLGALGTWSTFMTDAVRMWSSGRRGAAVVLVVASIGYGLLAAVAGAALGSVLLDAVAAGG